MNSGGKKDLWGDREPWNFGNGLFFRCCLFGSGSCRRGDAPAVGSADARSSATFARLLGANEERALQHICCVPDPGSGPSKTERVRKGPW